MAVRVASHRAARSAGRYAMRPSGSGLCSAAVLGALGSRVDVWEPEPGVSWRGTSEDKRIRSDVLRKLLVQLAHLVDLNAPLRLPPWEPRQRVKVRQRASRRAVDEVEAEARVPRVAWEHDPIGPWCGLGCRNNVTYAVPPSLEDTV